MTPRIKKSCKSKEQRNVLELETGRQRKNEFLFQNKDKTSGNKSSPLKYNKRNNQFSERKEKTRSGYSPCGQKERFKGVPLIGSKPQVSKKQIKMRQSNSSKKKGNEEFKEMFMDMIQRDSEALKDIMLITEEVIQENKPKQKMYSERNTHRKPNQNSKQSLDKQKRKLKTSVSVKENNNVIQNILNKAYLPRNVQNKNKEIKSMRGDTSMNYKQNNLSLFESKNIRRFGSNNSFFGINHFDKRKTLTNKNYLKKKIKSQSNFQYHKETNNEKGYSQENYMKCQTELNNHSNNRLWSKSKNELSPYFKNKNQFKFEKPHSAVSFQENRKISSWSINGVEEEEENLMESEIDYPKVGHPHEHISNKAQASDFSLTNNPNYYKKKSNKNLIFEQNSLEEINIDPCKQNKKDQFNSQNNTNNNNMNIYQQNKNEIHLLKNIVMQLQEKKEKEEETKIKDLKSELENMKQKIVDYETKLNNLENEKFDLKFKNQKQKEEIIKLNSELIRAKETNKHLKEMSKVYKQMKKELNNNEYELGNSYDINTLRTNIRKELSKQSSDYGSIYGSKRDISMESDWENLLKEKKKSIANIKNKIDQIRKSEDNCKKFSWNPTLSNEVNMYNQTNPMFNLYRNDDQLRIHELYKDALPKESRDQDHVHQKSTPNHTVFNKIYNTNDSKNRPSSFTTKTKKSFHSSFFDSKKVSPKTKKTAILTKKIPLPKNKMSKKGKKMIYRKVKGKLTYQNNMSYNKTQPLQSAPYNHPTRELLKTRYTFNTNSKSRHYMSMNNNDLGNKNKKKHLLKKNPNKYLKSSFITKKLGNNKKKMNPKYSLKNIIVNNNANQKISFGLNSKKIKKEHSNWFKTPKVKTQGTQLSLLPDDISPYNLNKEGGTSERNSFNPSNYISLKSPKYSPVPLNPFLKTQKYKKPRHKSSKPKKVFIPQSLLRDPLNEIDSQNLTKYYIKQPIKPKTMKNKDFIKNTNNLTVGNPKKISKKPKLIKKMIKKNKNPNQFDFKNLKKTSLFYKQHEQKKKQLLKNIQ
jgi:hypothetical protein